MVKKQLKMANGFNYSVRKFHLQSDKYVDRFMPTNPSVANIIFDDWNMAALHEPVANIEMNESTI